MGRRIENSSNKRTSNIGFCYNAVGHSVLLVDGDCTSVQVNLFEAFGGIEQTWGNSDNNRLANTKERDASIALDNHGFRYYDASIGRYISNDPIGYEGGFNLYVHCTNDPVNKFDPLGLSWWDTVTSVADYAVNGGYYALDAASSIAGRVQNYAHEKGSGAGVFAANFVKRMAEQGKGLTAKGFVEGAAADYNGYKRNGLSTYDSVVMAAGSRAPILGSAVSATEMLSGVSLRGTDFAKTLTGTDYFQRGAGVVGEAAGIGAGVAAFVKGGGFARGGSAAAQAGSKVDDVLAAKKAEVGAKLSPQQLDEAMTNNSAIINEAWGGNTSGITAPVAIESAAGEAINLAAVNYTTAPIGSLRSASLTDIQARGWYKANLKLIDGKIAEMTKAGASDEAIAELTHMLRNDAKLETRRLMQNQAWVENAPPLLSWKEALEKYKGDYKAIIEGSKRSNKEVNEMIEKRRKNGEK